MTFVHPNVGRPRFWRSEIADTVLGLITDAHPNSHFSRAVMLALKRDVKPLSGHCWALCCSVKL